MIMSHLNNEDNNYFWAYCNFTHKKSLFFPFCTFLGYLVNLGDNSCKDRLKINLRGIFYEFSLDLVSSRFILIHFIKTWTLFSSLEIFWGQWLEKKLIITIFT